MIVLNSRPSLFGIEASVNNPILSDPATLLRLYRNGHLEYFEIQRPSPEADWPNNPMRLFSYRMAVIVLHFLRIAKDLMQLAEVNEPIAVTAYWEYFNPSYMPHPRGGTSWPGELFIWKEDSLTINLTVTDLSDPNAAARAIIDRLVNAYGYEDNPHFDSNGQFVKK